MIIGIAIALAVCLTGIAGLHTYWALGGLWPGRDEAELVRTVIGEPKRRRMPPAMVTWLAALAILLTAAWPLLLAGIMPWTLPGVLVGIVSTGIAAVFLLRGLAGYLPAWQRRHANEPFATMDRFLYAPLCLLLGGGYAFLIATADLI